MTKAETKTLLQLLAEVPDHRVGNAIRYSLRDILFLGIFAILCGAETYTGMQMFSELHIEELRQYLELPHGVPSHDVFGDVFSRVDIKAVERCFQIFVESIKEGENEDLVVALDGKTVRRSGNREHKAAHIETAYLSDYEIVLGQMATEEKSNELTAIPKLLEMLALKKCTVTIDAMGTHRDIAEAIHEKEAEYILPVKENQPLLLEDIKLYAETEILSQGKTELKKAGRYAETNNKGHGRIEKRECWLFDEAEWLQQRHDWPFLNGVAVLRSTRTILDTGETSSVLRFYIYSHKDMTADRFLMLQRKHWRIENNLHWCLDCCFHEDDTHITLGHAAVVINTFRKLCMQMLKADTSVKGSVSAKLQRCAWSFPYALAVVKNWAFS